MQLQHALTAIVLFNVATGCAALRCATGEQAWVLRVEGPPQVPDTCFVQVVLHMSNCKVTLQNGLDFNSQGGKVDHCSWLQLAGTLSGENHLTTTLLGAHTPRHGVSKWTLSEVGANNLHLTGPDGYSVLYKVVEKHVPNTDHLGSVASRKLRVASRR